MRFTSETISKAFAITSLIAVLNISCNDKADERPPNAADESAEEQMPMKKLDADSTSDMPVVSAPDSAAAMPNGYNNKSEKPEPK